MGTCDVDDLFLFGDRRSDLRRWRSEVREWLWRERRVLLNSLEARVLARGGHLDALGHRIRRSGIEPLRRSIAREVRGDRHGRAVDLRASIESRLGGIFFA